MKQEHDIEDGGDGSDATVREGYFPIRVVSQRTGVNSVTLRAWERRYGLLRPVRTPKGHRLYSADDIARVLRIVDWIDRGVSISRVRALLDRDEGDAADAGEHAAETSDWARYHDRILQAVSDFDEHRLDDTVNEALSLYPFVTVCERLLNPLASETVPRRHTVPGDGARYAFLKGYLQRKLAARVQFDARHAGGAPVLIAALPGLVNTTALLTLAIGCIGTDRPVLLLESALSAEDLIVAAERRRPAAIVLHGDAAQETTALSRHLTRLVEARLAPVVVAGPAARIHESLIAFTGARPFGDESLALVVRRFDPLPPIAESAP